MSERLNYRALEARIAAVPVSIDVAMNFFRFTFLPAYLALLLIFFYTLGIHIFD